MSPHLLIPLSPYFFSAFEKAKQISLAAEADEEPEWVGFGWTGMIGTPIFILTKNCL